MNTIFDVLLGKGVLVFIYVILVYSTTLEEHLQQLKVVLQLLQDNKLVAKISKCAFAQPWLTYLGM